MPTSAAQDLVKPIGFSVANWLGITLGANNVFVVYSDKLKNYANTMEENLVHGSVGITFPSYDGYYFLSINFKIPVKEKSMETSR